MLIVKVLERKLFLYKTDFLLVEDPELLKEMLLSIPDHISNEHVFVNNKKYKGCPHPNLPLEERKSMVREKIIGKN